MKTTKFKINDETFYVSQQLTPLDYRKIVNKFLSTGNATWCWLEEDDIPICDTILTPDKLITDHSIFIGTHDGIVAFPEMRVYQVEPQNIQEQEQDKHTFQGELMGILAFDDWFIMFMSVVNVANNESYHSMWMQPFMVKTDTSKDKNIQNKYIPIELNSSKWKELIESINLYQNML